MTVLAALIIGTGAAFFAGAHTVKADNLTPQQRAALQAELAQVEQESAAAQQQLQSAQAQSASLSRDIAVLDAKIKSAQLQIRAKNLLIQTLGDDINDAQKHIDNLEGHISNGKDTLADILRKTHELDQTSVAQVLLSQTSVSGFFKDLDTFESIRSSLADTFTQLRQDQASTTAEKTALTNRQSAELDARHAIQVLQANIQADQADQKKLLAVSKGNEKQYQAVVTAKEQRAAQIRSALFQLSGTAAIKFGDAYTYATQVYKATGVPQSFLLAILKQETNIGGNVGTCYLTNTDTGAGLNARTNAAISNVMKPSRDVQPFISITQSLGLDYKSMPVSCPQSIGYGGGMGPAQFIASTWMLLKDRIGTAIGKSNPNPWSPLDAFMAAGIYLSDLGADSPSYSAQRNAACKYYSGRPCGYVTGASAYGNSVMALADQIQTNQINPLLGN